jgi:xanthine/uracil permease
MKLSKLDKYEQFTIPSINKKGVVLEHGLGSTLVMYYNVKMENKMGDVTGYSNVKTRISLDTEVVRHGKTDNKIQQRTEKS